MKFAKTSDAHSSAFPATGAYFGSLTEDIMSVDLDSFSDHLALKTVNASFNAISDKEALPTFIYTENLWNRMVLLPLLTLGVRKAATSHMLDLAM